MQSFLHHLYCNARARQAINVDIAVDLPYNRVAHRFFKVPEFLAKDFQVNLPVDFATF